ncbi:hypothetical protein [Pseudomonas aeruginosa]|uniref:hypothetical protein n=1 Tax=Pseudomonas aeruginosa TaxID=287 RepID=UPI0018DF4CA8|nr:hypothetical protein [Pseudomonas aeruginosa]
MIDPADKQTQALPLEQPKRGRGRPATGKALSDAERARRYRANKKNRNAQPSRKETPSIPADGVKEILDGWQRTQGARPGTATNYRAGSRISVTRHEKRRSRGEDLDAPGRSGSGKWQNLAAGLDRKEASRQLDRVIDNKLLDPEGPPIPTG